MKSTILIFVFVLGLLSQIWAYDTNDSISIDRKLALNIYLDCPTCDLNYFKENFSVVNYVREAEVADVQIQLTTLTTGSGGTEYNLLFFGRKRFKNVNDTLVFSLPPDKTYDETRTILLQKIQLSLVPYLMKTAYANHLYLTVDNFTSIPIRKKDPWKKWMFDIYGSGSLFSEKYTKNFHFITNLYLSKVTPEIKIESSTDMSYNETRIEGLPLSGDETYSNNTFQRGLYTRNLFVKSMGEHFGIGGLANFKNNKLQNIHFQMKVGPAIEYNFFKYSEAAQKQLRFLYNLGYEHSNYDEITIYNKMNDKLYSHNLRILFTYIKPWGYFSASLYGSNYINNFSHFSLGTRALTNIRIVKGFGFNVSCGLNMYRDQLSLKKGLASLEDLLTQQRQIASEYSFNISIGLSFRFGSTLNNTVNPRFSN